MYRKYRYQERGFVVPFLLGGLTGSAIVGLSRPRPIYSQTPMQGYPYYNASYSYYQPMPHTYYY